MPVKRKLTPKHMSRTGTYTDPRSFASKRKVHKVMKEFKEGTLKSRGRVITNRKQAIAIALNQASKRRAKTGSRASKRKSSPKRSPKRTRYYPLTFGCLQKFRR